MKRKDIVLIQYPFTDHSQKKVRPALIISSEQFHKSTVEAIFVFITSRPYNTSFDYRLISSHSAFNLTGLKKDSTFRVGKIMCLERKLVSRLLGEVNSDIMDEIVKRVKILLSL